MKRQLVRAALAALSIAAAGLVAAPQALGANAHANAAAVCPAPAVGAARVPRARRRRRQGEPTRDHLADGLRPDPVPHRVRVAEHELLAADDRDRGRLRRSDDRAGPGDVLLDVRSSGPPDLQRDDHHVVLPEGQPERQREAAPKKNVGWALEISLDVEIAHAICQNCKILLVEASSNSFTNLAAAVDTAARLGANVISNSYGGAESSGVSSLAGSYDHPGVAVTVSSGDAGYGTESPASFNTVVAVGGTTLNINGNDTWASETVWSGTGSGCSGIFNARSWQTAASGWAATGCGTHRGVVDVAADANPSTGASVYDTTRYQGQTGWFQVGGTSLSAPLIGAVFALAANSGSASYPASLPYAHTTSLHDVTSGSNGSCSTTMCKGAVGYDGPTGVGTPNGLGAF